MTYYRTYKRPNGSVTFKRHGYGLGMFTFVLVVLCGIAYAFEHSWMYIVGVVAVGVLLAVLRHRRIMRQQRMREDMLQRQRYDEAARTRMRR